MFDLSYRFHSARSFSQVSASETCENERALWNIRTRIKAEQTELLSIGGQYDEEVAPASTSCCVSGEPKPLAHLSQCVLCVCVCVSLTFSNRVSSSLTSFWTSSISALKKVQTHDVNSGELILMLYFAEASQSKYAAKVKSFVQPIKYIFKKGIQILLMHFSHFHLFLELHNVK